MNAPRSTDIAIVGMGCRYPDAASPGELWRNVLAQRRAFRRMPAERLRLEDYAAGGADNPDSIYATNAAVLEGWEFDRAFFRIAGPAFRAADPAHWLALDVAFQALADAGFADPATLPRETTGVIVGNTLTGEFSRANTLRLRWPYVRRVLDASLGDRGWSAEERQAFLSSVEESYKSPFPAVGDETLAGGLSNTIAGRICNQFDLKGGGYTVDGACSASLLAVSTACASLVTGDLDVALAGGVDLSLDPFELVGFARLGALAPELMRVYDARSAGFWPGEGCGFVVLMRYADALARGARIYALVRGWGVASDGSGGITRPEVEGHLLAVRRAYRRAGYGADTVSYFEGHGTGTAVGDAVELEALSRARREADPAAAPAALGSIKANIGHTKAAAGVAGLIKATMAVYHQIQPPTTGSFEPHPGLSGAAVRVLRAAEHWPAGQPLRAGVSAMGFGGIDTHVTVEGLAPARPRTFDAQERLCASTPQDGELLVFGAGEPAALLQAVTRVRDLANRISFAELTDLAATLARDVSPSAPWRAAVVAATPATLAAALDRLVEALNSGTQQLLDARGGVFLGRAADVAPRLGYLFTGQGAPVYTDGGLWARRFECVRELYAAAALARDLDPRHTAVAQPAIVTASMAALQILATLGFEAGVAIGHSLGELTAYHWAGGLDAGALVRLATVRGRAMGDLGEPGAMASLAADAARTAPWLAGGDAVVAGLNAPDQTVISGSAEAVDAAIARARSAGVAAVRLPVTRAFHSPRVAAAAPVVATHLEQAPLSALQRSVYSTVTGRRVAPGDDLARLLVEQVVAPVRFSDAFRAADAEVDLWIEVGPGQTLRALAAPQTAKPVFSVDAGSNTFTGLLQTMGAAWVLGTPVAHAAGFASRFTKPFELDWKPRFLANPCEQAPWPEDGGVALLQRAPRAAAPEPSSEPVHSAEAVPAGASALAIVRQLVAAKVELAPELVHDSYRLLADLHLNSIVVSQVAATAAQRLGLPPLVDPTAYAGATVAELAQALEELAATGGSAAPTPAPALTAGIDAWVRPFATGWIECGAPGAPRAAEAAAGAGTWQVVAPANHPMAGAIERALATQGAGHGVVVVLPDTADESCAPLLLQAAQALWPMRAGAAFVVVQTHGGGDGFARSLHLESPETATCVIDVPHGDSRLPEWVAAEAVAVQGFRAVAYDAAGVRREPVLTLLESTGQEPLNLGAGDVFLVTGGGKGIAAECALALAQRHGVKVGLVGRSRPADDTELEQNLERLRAHGVQFHYAAADVADAPALQAAVREIQDALGPVTGVLHGAGANVPRPLSALDEAEFLHTVAPKLAGARNIAAAVDPGALKVFIAFGSIIARCGMRGEADYAAANEWLTHWVRRFQLDHPACRCVSIEWSVWSGAGMGERMGRIDALVRDGITPIPVDIGVAWLERLLSTRLADPAVVVAGRFGVMPTLQLTPARLPLRRFLEEPRVFYPGIELIADVEMSGASDPYLDDHQVGGERVFPAVLGLEAMAEAGMALDDTAAAPVFEAVEFARPIVVPQDGQETLRVVALRREPGVVDVALRCAQTQFRVDHFRARCRFDAGAAPAPLPVALAGESFVNGRLDLEPRTDLYGSVLFQDGRFRRVGGYRWLQATECWAEINADGHTAWFGAYLPAALVLGDPGARDAAIHAIQACIPHRTLLPIHVERIETSPLPASEGLAVRARERRREGDTFIYDLEIAAPGGGVLERWTGLALRAVGPATLPGAWAAPLLTAYFQRQLDEFVPGVAVGIVPRGAAAGDQDVAARALETVLARRVRLLRRSDGKPELAADTAVHVSAAYSASTVLAVAGGTALGCDVELVVDRSEDEWRRLLGDERHALAMQLMAETGEPASDALTRVWTAMECVKKAGLVTGTPMLLRSAGAGWVVLGAGDTTIASFIGTLRAPGERLSFAVLGGRSDAVV